MNRTVLDDRFLARVAYQAAGRGADAVAGGADAAFGQAVVALEVQGAPVGSEARKVLRADIEAIFAHPAELARARIFAGQRRAHA